MAQALRTYLSYVEQRLRLEPGEEQDILRELRGHVEERAEELQLQGMSPEQATQRALQEIGRPGPLARELYAVHSRASWTETLLAALPHLLVALLFALHLWSRLAWLAVVLGGATYVTFRAWRRGRPLWTYPWLSYCLAAPVALWLATVVALLHGIWHYWQTGSFPLPLPLYGAFLLFVPTCLWSVIAVVRRVIQRDWLLASLTALPFPFLVGWLLFFQDRLGLASSDSRQLYNADVNTAFMFLALALVTAIFFRIGQRLLRITLLVSAAPTLLLLTYLVQQSSPNVSGFFLLSVASVALLLSPALVEPHAGREGTLDELLGEG